MRYWYNYFFVHPIKQNGVIKQLEKEKHQAQLASKAGSKITIASQPNSTEGKDHPSAKARAVTKESALQNDSTGVNSIVDKDNAVTSDYITNKDSAGVKDSMASKDISLSKGNDVATAPQPAKTTKADEDDRKQNNQVKRLGGEEEKRDPALKLKRPADFDDFWYKGDDGEMYNEYNDDLEEGYYYADDGDDNGIALLPLGVQLPRPADYDNFWYEGEDGQMYNEYDDELEEGQFYEDKPSETAKVMNGTAGLSSQKSKLPGVVTPDSGHRKEEGAAAATADAAKAAEETAKAAAEASKSLLKGMSNLGGGLLGTIKVESKPNQPAGFGFGLGGLFGSTSEAEKKQKPLQSAPTIVKSNQAKPNEPLSAAVVTAAHPKKQPAAAKKELVAAQPNQDKPSLQTIEAGAEKFKAELAVPEDAVAVIPSAATITSKVAEGQDGSLNSSSRLTYTAGFNARQRWKWSYAMVKKVNIQKRRKKLVLYTSSPQQDRHFSRECLVQHDIFICQFLYYFA